VKEERGREGGGRRHEKRKEEKKRAREEATAHGVRKRVADLVEEDSPYRVSSREETVHS
jgi:hypothetical protein